MALEILPSGYSQLLSGTGSIHTLFLTLTYLPPQLPQSGCSGKFIPVGMVYINEGESPSERKSPSTTGKPPSWRVSDTFVGLNHSPSLQAR